MMRIVHWGKYYPPAMGGIESVTESLARGAAAAGHAVTVVNFHSGPASEEIAGGVRILRAPITARMASQPLGLRYLYWALREGRSSQVIHIHAPNMVAALAAVAVGRGPKLVVHWHSDVVKKGWLGRVSRPLEAALLRRADRIVCTSEAYADGSLPLRPFRDKVSVVPIGVADAAASLGAAGGLEEGLRERLRGKRLVLAVGRLVPYKGFDVLVDAASHLAKDSLIVIVGTGPLRASLQAAIERMGMGQKVVLAGRQDDEALRELFERAELFCLPSVERSEAFGVVLIEAMSHGLPIVATRIPGSGVAWVNSHGVSGLNVEVGDPRALAEACNQILAEQALRGRLVEGARRRYETEFTEQLANERMFHVYRSLLVNQTGEQSQPEEEDVTASPTSA
jgi:glycosyltransferase involved in cell wall biosynthesis